MKVIAARDLSIKNPNLDPRSPLSEKNPISVAVRAGDRIDLPDEFVDLHVQLGNVRRIDASVPVAEPETAAP